jgi:hypothetical protein
MRKAVTSAGFPTYRTIVEYERCSWMKQLDSRFAELFALPQGWDGYQGRSLSKDCYSFAENILNRLCIDSLPPPDVVPGGDGTLQLEWHLLGFDIELDVLGVYDVIGFRRNLQTGEEEEVRLEKDFTQVFGWINEIAIRSEDHDLVAA